jgi:hypothetical protein
VHDLNIVISTLHGRAAYPPSNSNSCKHAGQKEVAFGMRMHKLSPSGLEYKYFRNIRDPLPILQPFTAMKPPIPILFEFMEDWYMVWWQNR